MLDKKILQSIVHAICAKVDGDWLIFGGTVPYLIGLDTRPTMDIDLASFSTSTNQDSLLLMQIAEELGLPIETINQSGVFFLNRIKNWQSKVVLIEAGKKGRVFRPNLYLYLELKCMRMNETDLKDCLTFLNWNVRNEKDIDLKQLARTLGTQRKQLANPEAAKRIDRLLEEVQLLLKRQKLRQSRHPIKS